MESGNELESAQGISCDFSWETEPKSWGGFSQSDLTNLVSEVANFFRIPQGTKKKILVHFGDHAPFTFLDGRQETPVAKHIPTWDMYEDRRLIIAKSDIVLNRSLELAIHIYGNDDWSSVTDKSSLEDYDYRIKDEEIVATLRNAWEGVFWLIAEELNHAAVTHKLKTEQKMQNSEMNFTTYTQKFHKTQTLDVNYSYNLLEVAASREVLRFLQEKAKEINPERAAFFEQMRKLSTEKRMVVIPRTAFILDSMYVRTGFKPTQRPDTQLLK